MMTSRERLLALIDGKEIDRVPVAPFIQQEFMCHYLKKADTHRVVDACVIAKELGFDLMTREFRSKPHFLKRNFPNWIIDEKSVVENGNYFRITTIETPKKTFKQVEGAPYKKDILQGIHFVTTEFMIQNEEDFEIFSEYMPKIDNEHRKEIMEGGAFAKKHIGELGLNAPWCVGGVFNMVCTFIDIKNMLMDAMIDTEYYNAYMSFFTDIVCEDLKCHIESDYDIVGMQANMANGGLMGGEHFRKYILPYERRAVKTARDGGKPVLFHNCGRAKNLLPVYKDLGLSIYETLAAPPEGDTDLKETVKLFEDTDLILMGTFDQVNFLKKATPEEIFSKAAEIVKIGKPGGKYIFAASDYLEMGTPIENVKAMLAGAYSVADY